jgi:hypothetical protein
VVGAELVVPEGEVEDDSNLGRLDDGLSGTPVRDKTLEALI